MPKTYKFEPSSTTPREQCLAAVSIHLSRLPVEFDAAIAAIERYRKTHELTSTQAATQDELLETNLSETSLCVRTVNALEPIGVFTVGELLQQRRGTLLGIPNFGLRTLEEVFSMLRSLGIVVSDSLIEQGRASLGLLQNTHRLTAKHLEIADKIETTLRARGPMLVDELVKQIDETDSAVRYVIERSGRRFTRLTSGKIEAT